MRKALILVAILLLALLPMVRAESSGLWWAKSYGGSGDDGITDVKVLPDGSIIAVGYTYSFSAGWYDALVMKLNPDGSVAWAKTYGGSEKDNAWSVAIAPNGDIIVAGYTGSFGAGGWDFWVLRLDANGNVKWQKTYGGSSRDWADAVAIADNGDIIVAGHYGVDLLGSYSDFWVLRLDANGNVN